MTQPPPYDDDETPVKGTTGSRTVRDRRDDQNARTIEEEDCPPSTRRATCPGLRDDSDEDADHSNSPNTNDDGANAVLHYWDRRRNPASSSSSSSSPSPHGGSRQTKLDALFAPTSPPPPLIALSLSSSSLSSSTVSPSRSLPLDMRDDLETVSVAKLRRRRKQQHATPPPRS